MIQSKWTKAWDCHKFQVPGFSYNGRGFQPRDTLQDITGNSSIDKVESSLDPHNRAPKKNTSHENEVLPQDTTHLLQRPCYQWGSPCQDPAGNRTTWRPPDHHKEMQTAVVWSSLPFIRSGQKHLARHNERGKKTRQKEDEVGMDSPGVKREKWKKLVANTLAKSLMLVFSQMLSKWHNVWNLNENTFFVLTTSKQ